MESISDLIRSLCVSGKLKGLRYLAMSVKIVTEDENALFGIAKVVYPAVAKEYHTSVTCVERNIRTIISACWENGGKDRLCELAGFMPIVKPTNGEMIDILANYVRKQKNSPSLGE